MKKIICFAVFLFSFSINAQDYITIKGKVTSKNKAVAFANIESTPKSR